MKSASLIVLLSVALGSGAASAAGPTAKETTPPPATRGAKAGVTGLETARPGAGGSERVSGKVGGQGTAPAHRNRVYDGVVAPGDSPGCISDAGNVTFSSNSSLVIEIGGSVPCTQHDRFGVSGNLVLQGGTLKLELIGGFVPPGGAEFDILDFDPARLTGTFGRVDVALAPLPAGFVWDISELYTRGIVRARDPAIENDIPMPAWANGLLGGCLLLGALAFARRGKT
jgi:hypothetical protein